MRTERAVFRFSASSLTDLAGIDSWLMELAAHPDGELTRSDHRIHGRRRWLDARTWVQADPALLESVVERRWHFSPTLWENT